MAAVPTPAPAPTLSPQAQALITTFGQQPGVTAEQVTNLQSVINHSPALITQINGAVAAGHLTQIQPLPLNTHAGGQYVASQTAMQIPLSILTTPARGAFNPGEPTYVLGHELQHGFNHAAKDQAYQTFRTDAAQIARSPTAVHDYTQVTANLITANRLDESGAQVGGWNATVSMVKNTNPTPSIEDIYRANPSRMQDYINVSASTPTTYTMKPNITLNADMSMSPTAANLEAMGQAFFDKPGSVSKLGHGGNSDYKNYYGTYAASVISQYERQLAQPLPDGSMPQMTLNMNRLGLTENQLEQNGVDLGAAGRRQLYFDSSTQPATQHHFDHTLATHQHVPVPRPPDAPAGAAQSGESEHPSHRQALSALQQSVNIPAGTFSDSQMFVAAATLAAHALSEKVAPEHVVFNKQQTDLIPLQGKSVDDPGAKIGTPLPVTIALNTPLSESLNKIETLQPQVQSTAQQIRNDQPAQAVPQQDGIVQEAAKPGVSR